MVRALAFESKGLQFKSHELIVTSLLGFVLAISNSIVVDALCFDFSGGLCFGVQASWVVHGFLFAICVGDWGFLFMEVPCEGGDFVVLFH